MQEFIAWLVTFLVSVRPSGHLHDAACQQPDDEYRASVAHQVDSAASVVFDEEESTIVRGPMALERSLVDVLAVAHHESMGWCKAVLTGERKGDHGHSSCAMGIMEFGGYADGFPSAWLIEEPRVCYLVGYHRMKRSWGMCRGNPWPNLLVYASGRCDRGSKASREMLTTMNAWWGRAFAAWQAGEW